MLQQYRAPYKFHLSTSKISPPKAIGGRKAQFGKACIQIGVDAFYLGTIYVKVRDRVYWQRHVHRSESLAIPLGIVSFSSAMLQRKDKTVYPTN